MWFWRENIVSLRTQNYNRGRVPQKLIDMPVKIRLQRHGKKGKPFYWIVAADTRAKRDGRFLEKLGIYNPNTNPATIDINMDSSVEWLQKGAQPTDTARAILSYKGVLLKKHLLEGVRKGALTEEQAEEKLNAWLADKGKAIDSKKSTLAQAEAKAKEAALAAEKAVNEARIAAAQPVEEVVEEVVETAEEVVEETAQTIDEVAEEAKKAAEGAVEAVEEAVEKVTPEAAKEEE